MLEIQCLNKYCASCCSPHRGLKFLANVGIRKHLFYCYTKKQEYFCYANRKRLSTPKTLPEVIDASQLAFL